MWHVGAWVLVFAPFFAARRWAGGGGVVDAELRLRLTLMGAAAAASVCGALAASAHVGRGSAWWQLADLAPAGVGVLVASTGLGLLSAWLERSARAWAGWLVALPLLLAAPHLGPRSELVEGSRFRAPSWRDGVCLQSTGFTCTVAAGATLLRALGVEGGESELAARCATEKGGTRLNGLAKGLTERLRGTKRAARACRFDPAEIVRAPLPLVAFAPRHAFVVFGRPTEGTLEIGDPVGGRLVIRRSTFEARAIGVGVVLAPLALPDHAPPPWGTRLEEQDPGAFLRFGAADVEPWTAVR
jgi:hypothetical protein